MTLPNPEILLMQRIHAELGDYILGAIEGTKFPAPLLAAITANESDGVPTAQRLEPDVLSEFMQMVAGQKLSFAPAGIKAPITVQQMTRVFVSPSFVLTGKLSVPSDLLALLHLSTSFGPTQIMGWHAVEFGYDIADLTNLATHFERAVELLEQFDLRYSILSAQGFLPGDVEPFLRCWNTGSPVGKTFDPDYVAIGENRFDVYGAILNGNAGPQPDAGAAAKD